jgi:ABC-type glycerol-3-phosphate transport system permease component
MADRKEKKHIFYFERVVALALVLPIVFYLALFTVFPVIQDVYVSFSSGAIFSLNSLPDFWQTISNTAVFSLSTVLIEFAAGTFLAILLDRTKYGSFFLILLTIPLLISPVAVGVIWLLILDPQFGPLNSFLSIFGIRGPFWVGSQNTIMLSAVLASSWEETPIVMLIVYAALKSIPRQVYEAAEVDGVGTLSLYGRIILPMIKPSLAVASLLALMTSFRSFDLVYMFAINGPVAYVQTLPYLLYQVAFVSNFQQYGYAISIIIMSLALIPTYFLLRLMHIGERLGLAKKKERQKRFNLPNFPSFSSFNLPGIPKEISLSAKYLILILSSIISLFPFYWVLTTSLKNVDELFPFGGGAVFFPTKIDLSGWYNALHDMSGYIITSTSVTFFVVLITLALSIPAAYSISRYKTFGTKLVSWNIVVNSMPSVVFVIPFFFLVKASGLYDTWIALILTYPVFTLPIVTWLLVGFMEDIPKQIDEAAKIDGLGPLSILYRIILPLAKPGIVASVLLSIINCWHEFLLTLILGLTVFNGRIPYGARGVTVYVANFISARGIDWSTISAAAVIVSLPLILIVIFLQKYYISGLTLGSVKS